VPVPGLITVVAVVLLLWGLITLVRRIAESEELNRRPPSPRPRRTDTRLDDADDDIDWEELRRAEDEVRDLGSETRPEDGWEGDDWGPGAPRKPPLV
jgi:hypothetical protein